MLKTVEFYSTDIQILKGLGYDVTVATTPREIDLSADLYFCWWWGHAPLVILLAKMRRKPVLVTGAFDYATCEGEVAGLSYLSRPAWQRLVLALALRLADRNLFISEFERAEVTAHLKVNRPECVTLSINSQFYYPNKDPQCQEKFFFAITWLSETNVKRKGLIQSLEAFGLIAKHNGNIKFIVAGKPGDYAKELHDKCRYLGIEDQVTFLGFISDQRKRYLYQNCIAYVQPTLYEGFGLAIGEALSCGVAVITSDRGAVREVVGEYASLLDPHDVHGIAKQMSLAICATPNESVVINRHNWIATRFSTSQRRLRLKSIIESYLN